MGIKGPMYRAGGDGSVLESGNMWRVLGGCSRVSRKSYSFNYYSRVGCHAVSGQLDAYGRGWVGTKKLGCGLESGDRASQQMEAG